MTCASSRWRSVASRRHSGSSLRRQLGDQVLEGAAVAEQAEVGQRAGGQQAAQQVERLGAGRRLPRPIGLARPRAGSARGSRCVSGSMQAAVGLEQRVARPARSPGAPAPGRGGRGAAVRPWPVEAHVARRLLERRDADAAVLQRLGGQRRDPLDRHVGARQLGHRVVAVADQHPLVELLGAPHRDHVVVGPACAPASRSKPESGSLMNSSRSTRRRLFSVRE